MERKWGCGPELVTDMILRFITKNKKNNNKNK